MWTYIHLTKLVSTPYIYCVRIKITNQTLDALNLLTFDYYHLSRPQTESIHIFIYCFCILENFSCKFKTGVLTSLVKCIYLWARQKHNDTRQRTLDMSWSILLSEILTSSSSQSRLTHVNSVLFFEVFFESNWIQCKQSSTF